MKLLSIIVPSYNMEKYLDVCLGSCVVEQGLMNLLDIIVVNDGSKDRTSEIAHDYERRYPEVFRVIDKPNGHYGSCINVALPVAVGKYVRLLDADDRLCTENLEDYLRRLVEVSEKDSPDVVFNDTSRISADGELADPTLYPFDANRIFGVEDVDGSIFYGAQSFVIKTSIFSELKYRQTEGCAYTDMEWYMIPFMKVTTCAYIPLRVVRVLFGRVGQTMETSTYARDFKTVANLTVGLVRRYQEAMPLATECGKRYVRDRIKGAIQTVYFTTLLHYCGIKTTCNLSEFDRELKSAGGGFYDLKFDKYKLPRLPISLDLIGTWRVRKVAAGVECFIVRRYLEMIGFLSRIKHMRLYW